MELSGLQTDNLLSKSSNQTRFIRRVRRAMWKTAHTIPLLHAVWGASDRQRLQHCNRRSARLWIQRINPRVWHGSGHSNNHQEWSTHCQHRLAVRYVIEKHNENCMYQRLNAEAQDCADLHLLYLHCWDIWNNITLWFRSSLLLRRRCAGFHQCSSSSGEL